MDYQIVVRYPDGRFAVRSYSLLSGNFFRTNEAPASQLEVVQAAKRNKIFDVNEE